MSQDYYIRIKGENFKTLRCFFIFMFLICTRIKGSEYPDRECCDSAPPPPPNYYFTTTMSPVPSINDEKYPAQYHNLVPPLNPTYQVTSKSAEGNIGGGVAVRNCLLSRKLCATDTACRAILEIIPRVCGPETVACSTVTVNKCLAALRTIRGFPYLSPVCLCREPHLDYDCNAFREFIFDHPCEFVLKDGDKSPYAVHALPTCEYALRACDQLPACRNTYQRFRDACREKDDRCSMNDGEECLRAWTQVKQLPMFGCICPDERQKKCREIFNHVHHNPCIDMHYNAFAPDRLRVGRRTSINLVFPSPAPIIPTPYSIARSPSYPKHYDIYRNPWYNKNKYPWESNEYDKAHVSYQPTRAPLFPHYQQPPFFHHQEPPHSHHPTPPPFPFMSQTHNTLSIDQPFYRVNHRPNSIPVNIIPLNHTNVYYGDPNVHNPLVNSHVGSAQNSSRAANVLGSAGNKHPGSYARLTTNSVGRVTTLKSTCQTVLKDCSDDRGCRRLLDPILASCGSDCNMEMCMDNLQIFYRNVESKWAMEVALCLCRRTDRVNDQCLIAQEKLHPACARDPALGSSPVLCSSLARSCKDDSGCRHRLEFYEQACAVDSDTRRCAGSTAECRRALLGILGTRLRNLCTCAGIPPEETYICVDWQKILWFNPCVVESQKDYHRAIIGTLKPGVDLTTSPSVYITPHSARITTPVEITIKKYRLPETEVKITKSRRPAKHYQPITSPPEPASDDNCTKILRNGMKDNITEGHSKRYYKQSDACSEMCSCYIGKNLVCNTLPCIPMIQCVRDFAVYAHASPTYQAFRGECICYSKSFICARPEKEKYDLDYGVFLLLGYSKKEEELLGTVTKMSIKDSLEALQNFYEKRHFLANNQSSCYLKVFSHVGENLIVRATMREFEEQRENYTSEMWHVEKEICEKTLKEISDMVNEKHTFIQQDVALSLLLVSEVQSSMPPPPSSGVSLKNTLFLSILCCLTYEIL